MRVNFKKMLLFSSDEYITLASGSHLHNKYHCMTLFSVFAFMTPICIFYKPVQIWVKGIFELINSGMCFRLNKACKNSCLIDKRCVLVNVSESLCELIWHILKALNDFCIPTVTQIPEFQQAYLQTDYCISCKGFQLTISKAELKPDFVQSPMTADRPFSRTFNVLLLQK